MHYGLLISKFRRLSACLLALQVAGWGQSAGQTLQSQPPGTSLPTRDLTPQKLGVPVKASVTVPRGWALLIGISKYELIDPAQNLRFPESDAQSIYRVMISKEAGAIPSENVHILVGSQATKENIRRQLEEWLPSVAQSGDTVFVFFAGHGFVAGGRGYFAPWDIDPEHVEQTGYSMTDFGRTLETKVKAANKILFVDACRSGKVSRGLVEQGGASSVELVNAQLGRISNSFLTFVAAREQDSSFEDPNLGSGAGLFSYFVVRGLEGDADANCDGVVTADELIEYVRSNVRKYAHDRGQSQTPTDYGDFEPSLVLSIDKRCQQSSPDSMASGGDLIVEGNMEGIDIYLDDQPVGSISPGKPLRLSGIAGGIHTVMGVRKGYETDSKQATVIPGQQRSVSIRIQYAREYKKQSKMYMDDGEKLLLSRRSSFNPLAVYLPSKQNAQTLQRAASLFQRALQEDSENARAAYDLGLAYIYLDRSTESLAALREAVTIDPVYVEAKTQYAGELIESGDTDEAIRQLTDALRLDPSSDLAWCYLSRAYYDKGVFDKSVESADHALALRKNNEQAYLWKGAALRLQAAHITENQAKLNLYRQSCDAFESFVGLTNFSAPAYAQILFYLSPIPSVGYRSHADRAESYRLQKSIALEGLCDGENKLNHPVKAASYCEEAIKEDPNDPVAYYLLGHVHRDLFSREHTKEELLLARDNYQKVVTLNPDLEISRNARNYLDQIQALLERINQLSKNQ